MPQNIAPKSFQNQKLLSVAVRLFPSAQLIFLFSLSFFRHFFRPFGIFLGLRASKRQPAATNDVLEECYETGKGTIHILRMHVGGTACLNGFYADI